MKNRSVRPVVLASVLAVALTVGACSDDAGEDAGASPIQATGAPGNGQDGGQAPAEESGTDDEHAADGEETSDQEGDTHAADDQTTVRRDSTVHLTDQEGARADLHDFVCEADGGTWSTSGTINNPTDDDLVYVASVNIVYVEGRSSLIRQNFIMDVPANGSASFEEAEFVESDRDDLECTTRVVRGTSIIEGDD